MLSQPATKIFLKTTEPKAAEWVSKAIGQVEIERVRETHQLGSRQWKSFTVDRQTEPLVMDSEISGLPDKHAFLKLGNYVARFAFTYCDLQPVAPAFQPRPVEDDELGFDPITLKPRRTEAKQQETATVLPTSADLPQDSVDTATSDDANTKSATEFRGEIDSTASKEDQSDSANEERETSVQQAVPAVSERISAEESATVEADPTQGQLDFEGSSAPTDQLSRGDI